MAVEVIYDDWLSLRMRLTADIFASKVSGVGFTDKIIQFFFFRAFRFNSISVLREHDLSGLENVELLMVHSNMIERIEDRTFGDLRSLQVKQGVG